MSRNHSRINRLLIGLLAAGLCVPAVLGQSVEYPTYAPGPQTNGTFIASDGTVLTPAGTQVNLGIRVRAKAIALNPTGNHTAAVLVMGTSGSNGKAVEVFNTQTGVVLQNYYPAAGTDPDGSTTGITYSPDGKYLLFSQDGSYGANYNGLGYVTIANVDPTTGLLTDYAQVNVAMDIASLISFPGFGKVPVLKNANCSQTVTMPVTGYKMSAPVGTTGSFAVPCGVPISIQYGSLSPYPTGIAVSPDLKTAYAVLNFNDTLAKIDLTQTPPVEVTDIRVGNVPHSVVISPDGTTAYVSNEAGRIANPKDVLPNSTFQLYSNGTPVVAQNPTGATATGTISVVNLSTFTVTGTISTGLHPTGMAFWGDDLLVANTYDDTLSQIDTTLGSTVRTISLGLPIKVPGSTTPAYGAGPNSIAVDAVNKIAYVALYNANAIAVVNLSPSAKTPVTGMIPVGYAPSSVVLDSADGVLLVANDKGWGTTGNPNPFQTAPNTAAPTTDNSTTSEFGSPQGLNTHQDLGTVSIIPVPNATTLATWTKQVKQNNHWDLTGNIGRAAGGSPTAAPVAIPGHIGDPSLIKHVFLIIRENRTYDQILGDVVGGNGDPSLATFGDNTAVTGQVGPVTPNAHTLVERFPLLDNFYDPSRQSADGHNWIVQAMAPYSDDIQSPDWMRDYPSNGGDALAYQNNGNLYNLAVRAGISLKNYGEYVEENTFNPPGCKPSIITSSCEPSWSQFYQDTVDYENGAEKQLYYYNTIGSYSPLPDVMNHTIQNYPQFDLGIPDQYRVDVWKQDFAADVAAGTVPQLEIMWISSDHTGGQPTAQAMQADNDLALGRFVDIISHSNVWSSSAIFVEEDDAQTGVDHVDGHRSPAYVISPYVYQKARADGTGYAVTPYSTYYSQVNLTRTIEQILGLTPMNQNDLVASPMSNLFENNPPANNFQPWTHVPNGIPLDLGVTPIEARLKQFSPEVRALAAGWLKKKTEIFGGKYHMPDSEDPDTVNHLNWYESTGFTRPYPGEQKVLPASYFNHRKAPAPDLD